MLFKQTNFISLHFKIQVSHAYFNALNPDIFPAGYERGTFFIHRIANGKNGTQPDFPATHHCRKLQSL